MLRIPVLALSFSLAGLLHAGAAEDMACKAPTALHSTHTMIPYPPISQRMGERGATRLLARLGADGTPNDISINKGSGSKRLDDAAASHIKTHYRWQPSAERCRSATHTVHIAVNWWLDPLPNPSAVSASEEAIEVIDVHAPCIHIWAYDGPISTSGSSACRVP